MITTPSVHGYRGSSDRWWLTPRWAALLPVLLFVAAAGPGCAREMTIIQADYINTGMYKQAHRGEPLELNIVSVYPRDLKNDANERLRPGSGITSKEWFADRPQPGDTKDMEDRDGRFWLKNNQVFLLTDSRKIYGKRVHPALRGAVRDKKKEVVVEFEFAGDLHHDESVIYVFAKFTDPNGDVLPVRPAVLHPPGAYTHELTVEVGVDDSRDNYGQYIINKTPRKLHGREEGEE